MHEQTQKEQNKLLKTILDYRYFNPWKHLTQFQDDRSLIKDSSLELYITSTCNQKCEYCYLQKYPKLYPAEYNKPDIILHNLDILLKYLTVNGIHLPLLDLYSGEIWHTQFGLDVLEMIYQYVSDKGLMADRVFITSNCSFVTNPVMLQKIQQYINKFNSIGCPLGFSISVDGKIVDDYSRPRNDANNKYTDEFYELLGAFAQTNNFYFHPMVASINVKHWKENYKWWIEYLKKFGFQKEAIMMLEVRNNDWTDESIQDYCDFLDFLIEDFLNDECKGDIKTLARTIVNMRTQKDDPTVYGYIPWMLGETDSFPGCTVANHMCVRLGDLAICPCHRQAYNEYLYGYFKVENDEIVDIEAVNTAMAIQILMGNLLTCYPLCSSCDFNYCCLHGCLGSQIEVNKDPFFPIENVCKFFKAKYSHLFKYYREHGIIKEWQSYSANELASQKLMALLRLNDKLEAQENGVGTI